MFVKNQSGEKVVTREITEFVLVECCECATPFLMSTKLNTILRNNKNTFYCPFGHQQGYYGKNEAEKLKDELAKIKSDKEKEITELQDKWLDEMSRANKLDKQLKKVHKGTCPCCKRSFQNLKNHMETKHPDVAHKYPVDAVHIKINKKDQ